MRATRKRHDRSQQQAAADLGISPNSLALYERGARLPDVEFLAKFAARFDLDLHDLVRLRLAASADPRARSAAAELGSLPGGAGHGQSGTGRDPGQPAPPRATTDAFVPLPIYTAPAPVTANGWPDSAPAPASMMFDTGWARAALGVDPHDLALVRVRCDAMEPVTHAGDFLLVDTSVDHFAGDGLYAIGFGGALMIKRMQRLPGGGLSIKSDNASYVDIALDPARLDELRILGRVRWIWRAI